MTTDQHPGYSENARVKFLDFCKRLDKDKLIGIIDSMMRQYNMVVWELADTAGELDLTKRMFNALDNGEVGKK